MNSNQFDPIPKRTEAIGAAIVDSALRVHQALGPGLMESIYEACLCHEVSKRKLEFHRQLKMPVHYDGLRLDAGYWMDLLVEDLVVVELKAVEQMLSLYNAQLQTYLRLSEKRLGLLINFNIPLLKDGIKRLEL